MRENRVPLLVAAVATAGLVLLVVVTAPDNCAVDDCAVANLGLGAAYVVGPLGLGAYLAERGDGRWRPVLPAVATTGVAAVATAGAFLVTMEPGDPERIPFAAGFGFVVAPLATVVGIALVASGARLRDAGRSDSDRGTRIVGALVLAAGAVMPWARADLDAVEVSVSGVGGRGLGFVALGSAIVILVVSGRASRHETRVDRTLQTASAAVALVLAVVVLVEPAIHYGGTAAVERGFGAFVSVAGAMVALSRSVGSS